MNKLQNIVLAAALAFPACAVQASTYSFEFLSTNYEVSGTLTVDDTLNSLGSYDILGISGIVWGEGGGTITGLVPNPNQPNPNTDLGMGFIWDNVFPLNVNGIVFKVGFGSKWNLFQEGQNYRLYSYNGEGPVGVVDSIGTFTATLNNTNLMPVPEPETYAMMLAGLGLLGLVARRRRQSLPATTA